MVNRKEAYLILGTGKEYYNGPIIGMEKAIILWAGDLRIYRPDEWRNWVGTGSGGRYNTDWILPFPVSGVSHTSILVATH